MKGKASILVPLDQIVNQYYQDVLCSCTREPKHQQHFHCYR